MNKDQIEPLEDDFEIWYKSKSESFLYINERSRVFSRWLSYQEALKNNNCANEIIKPINLYAQNLYTRPKLISIVENEVVLQQTNHAEIFLLQEKNRLYNVDRPWIRQYYLSDMSYELPENCFDGVFRFYIPWFIDEEVLVKIEQPDNSPFKIYEKEMLFTKIGDGIDKIDPEFVHFHFKSVGTHIVEPGFAKIPRQSPMYNLRFKASDIMVERVRNFYGQNNVLSI